jgi:hypothetical protein
MKVIGKTIIGDVSPYKVYHFDTVKQIPSGYVVWNIGPDVIPGYLPLAKMKNATEVDVDTLKAVKTDKAPIILALSVRGYGTPKKLDRLIAKSEGATAERAKQARDELIRLGMR